jgi:hypothetical protein
MKLDRQAGVRMKVSWKAACAAALLIAATTIEIGCGNTYRPVATPLPVTTGNPAGPETEVVLNQNPSGGSSALTSIDVSGDTNVGNKTLNNVTGSGASAVTPTASPMAFDFNRTSVLTANTSTDTVTRVSLNTATTGFAANTTTIALEPGSKPIGISFQYFGTTYTQDYVVNSGATASCPTGGSLGAVTLASTQLQATICLATATNPNPKPVFAWIYKDHTKVYVLDNNFVDVVSASTSNTSIFKVNPIPISVGVNPIKATQGATGQYVYVLNHGDGSGNGSVSIIDGNADTVVGAPIPTAISTASLATSAAPIDIAQDLQYNDTTQNLQYNHIWILLADGTVSVYDATTPGQLTWITSLATITAQQVAAGAYPTNLALMRDGTGAYVGLGNTSQIVAIDTSKLASQGVVTPNATTAITLDVIAGGISHRNVTQALTDTAGKVHAVTVEATVPTVSYVAVSRGGNSSDLSKVYAATTTSTTYFYYDANVNPTSGAPNLVTGCTVPAANPNSITCPNLYNGTAVVTAAGSGATPINTFVTTILSPWVGTFPGPVVAYCDAGNPETGEYDGQKNCPAMIPVMVLGRS